MGTNLITVNIPAANTEKSRGRGAKGWWRHVVRCDRTQKGGYAFVGETPFLDEGERLLAPGSVLMEADHDHTARLHVVALDGRTVRIRDTSGDHSWTDYRTRTQTLCDQIEALLTTPLGDTLRTAVERLEVAVRAQEEKALAPYSDVGDRTRLHTLLESLETVRGHLAAWQAATDAEDAARDPRAALLAERASLLARLAEVDALLAR